MPHRIQGFQASIAKCLSALITYFLFAGVAFWLDNKRA